MSKNVYSTFELMPLSKGNGANAEKVGLVPYIFVDWLSLVFTA